MTATAVAPSAAPRSREGAAQKGRRILTEGRVCIVEASPGHVLAQVRGEGAFYVVSFDAGEWACSCPARQTCSHLVGVKLVTAPEWVA